MDFEEDIRRFVLGNLPHEASLTAELQAKTAQQLLIIFGNWRSRLVSAKPRRVHLSTALLANPLFSDPRYKPGLDTIIAKLRNGQDIKGHLSRGVRYGYKPPTPRRPRQDLDLLLNDWGVHHLHLSDVVEGDGFVRRTGPLLFAIVRPDDAYLIDIISHGGWTREHVIETIVTEWPNERLVWELKEVIASGKNLTDDERKNLRANHVNASFEIKGRTYMPVGGLTAAGTSIMNTISVQHLFRTLNWFGNQVTNDPGFLSKVAAESGVLMPAQPDLHFEFFAEGGYGVVETKSGLRMRLSY